MKKMTSMNSKTTSLKTKSLPVLLACLFLSISSLEAQFIIPEPPKKIDPVNDFAQVLTRGQLNRLNEKLIHYSNSTSTQILIVIIKSLNGEDPNLVGANWGQKWKIGQEKSDNGLVLLLAIDDKKVSIQTGYGIEPYLTDALSKRIIENQIKPALQQGDHYTAIDQGTTAIFQILKDAYKNKKHISKKEHGWGVWLFYIGLIFFILYFFRSGGGKSMYYDDAAFTLSGMGRWNDGWGSNSAGGGSFGGFGGGGSFGGGGASGSW